MLTAVRGYYDGKHIVVDERDRAHLNLGDQLIITVLGGTDAPRTETLAEKRRRILAEEKYVRPSGSAADAIDRHIREQRDHDRI